MKSNPSSKPKFNWFKMFWEGFTHMTPLGKTLWIVVIIKLTIMFLVLKPFFFPKQLNQFEGDEEKANHVIEQLVDKSETLSK